MPTMRPQQDFSKSSCPCCCPPLLSCSFLVPLGLPSQYPSTSLVVFPCFLFPPIVCQALQPVVYFPPSLSCARYSLAFFSDLSTNVIFCPSSFLVTSFRILSLLDLPRILHSQLISNISTTSILLSSCYVRHKHIYKHVSDPYIITAHLAHNNNVFITVKAERNEYITRK